MAKKKAKKNLSAAAQAKEKKFKDTDADGLFDFEEIKIGTNPKKADSDNDGLNDYEEFNVYGTDPLNPDTDGDGVEDGDEVKQGYNPKGPGMLEDLFIPNIFNNFKPQSLHPKRIIFYSISAILFKAILVITVMILPIEAWLTPNILEAQSRQVISLTNTIRKNLNLAPLNESQRLDQAAFAKAEDMLINQYFSHTGPDKKTLADWLEKIKYNFSAAGENLAMGFASPEEVVNGWSRSQTHYRNMIDPEFKEIGVGMVSGLYDTVDTTLVAQYFGAPVSLALATEENKTSETLAKPAVQSSPTTTTASTSRLLGEKVNETTEAIPPKQVVKATPPKEIALVTPPKEVVKVTPPSQPVPKEIAVATATPVVKEEIKAVTPEPDITPPVIDQSKSKIYVDQPQGQAENIVRAEVYLSPDTAKAQVNFNNYFINLQLAPEEPGSSATLTASKWIGQTIIFKEGQEQIFKPVVLASVTAEDLSGNRITEDLPWDNIKPQNTTVLEQYYFIRQHQSSYIEPLFNVTSILYKIILIIAIIALGLNIFIHIKKQYPRVILSTLGLIALLVILIII